MFLNLYLRIFKFFVYENMMQKSEKVAAKKIVFRRNVEKNRQKQEYGRIIPLKKSLGRFKWCHFHLTHV
jgi:hypothetical protein